MYIFRRIKSFLLFRFLNRIPKTLLFLITNNLYNSKSRQNPLPIHLLAERHSNGQQTELTHKQSVSQSIAPPHRYHVMISIIDKSTPTTESSLYDHPVGSLLFPLTKQKSSVRFVAFLPNSEIVDSNTQIVDDYFYSFKLNVFIFAPS